MGQQLSQDGEPTAEELIAEFLIPERVYEQLYPLLQQVLGKAYELYIKHMREDMPESAKTARDIIEKCNARLMISQELPVQIAIHKVLTHTFDL